MTRSIRIGAAIAAFTMAGLAALAHAPAAKADAGRFACHPTRIGTKFQGDVPASSTTGNQFQPVPNTKIKFRPKAGSCLVVTFTATITPGDLDAVLARAVLDGNTVLDPGQILLANDSSGTQTTTAQFFLNKIPPGKRHRVEIEWKSLFGNEAFMGSRSVEIKHE